MYQIIRTKDKTPFSKPLETYELAEKVLLTLQIYANKWDIFEIKGV